MEISKESAMLICRPHYERLLERHRGSSLIKVPVGVRRCGKSNLLRLFADGVARRDASEKNIVHVKLDEYGIYHLIELDTLCIRRVVDVLFQTYPC